jgi:hypothetical protein
MKERMKWFEFGGLLFGASVMGWFLGVGLHMLVTFIQYHRVIW